jgi:hypothetical protein
MAALTSALAVTHTAGAFQTALNRRACGGETSRGVVCVARASARAQSALAGVSRPGRVVFSERRNAEGGDPRDRATAGRVLQRRRRVARRGAAMRRRRGRE